MSATHYDPDKAPDAKGWLALDEQERIRLARNYHTARRIKLPNAKAHAIFHAIVENQIAEGFGPSCRALERLQREGLSRHDAIHAIASVLASSLFEAQKNPTAVPEPERQRAMNQAIEELSAAAWRKGQ
jgi:hypothetical protein